MTLVSTRRSSQIFIIKTKNRLNLEGSVSVEIQLKLHEYWLLSYMVNGEAFANEFMEGRFMVLLFEILGGVRGQWEKSQYNELYTRWLLLVTKVMNSDHKVVKALVDAGVVGVF